MIFDTLENLEMYIPVLPQLKTIAEAMDHDNVYELAPGKYKTPNENVSYEICEYTSSASDKPFEFHKNTTVVEIVLSGCELMSTTWRELKDQASAFDKKTDTGVFPSEPVTVLQAAQGRFAVFFAGEPYKTGISYAEPVSVKKIIFRVDEK